MYNASQLFDIVFGVKPEAVYQVPNQPETKSAIKYSGMEVITSTQKAKRLSYLGTPILYPVTLKGGRYNTFSSDGDIVSQSFADFELPATTLASFRRAKIMTKTKALAANGTVKELYGFTDWAIDIRGFCLRDPGHPQWETPEAQVEEILNFERIADSIIVEGDLFSTRNIYRITIDDHDIPQVKGRPGVIPFYLRCSSDEPIELIL